VLYPDAEDAAKRRHRMVEQQLVPRGVRDPRVLAALEAVPREAFVPEEVVRGPDGVEVPLDALPEVEQRRLRGTGDRVGALAHADCALHIGWGQTISQPYIVGYMSEHLRLEPTHRVLEVGTGSGYQSAILAELAGEVYSIEIVEPLGRRVAGILHLLGYGGIHLRIGDGHLGWPEEAPFDRIIVTCAPEDLPESLVDQLAEGGRMVIPVGEHGYHQTLTLIERREGRATRSMLIPVSFVPMTRGPGVDRSW
jgi:protein-L-isoaspartate(D-aspartate) O-methyltransferase